MYPNSQPGRDSRSAAETIVPERTAERRQRIVEVPAVGAGMPADDAHWSKQGTPKYGVLVVFNPQVDKK